MIYLLLGPSGSGKSTLAEHLKQHGIPEIKSHTTRSIRPGEVPADQGGTYHFVTKEEFRTIEFIEKTQYNGNWYGTSKQEADKWVNTYPKCFAIVDSHGAEQFKAIYGEELVRVIYVHVSPQMAAERMRTRGDDEDAIVDRIRHGFRNGEFDNYEIADHLIRNRNLDESKRQLRLITGCPQIGDW